MSYSIIAVSGHYEVHINGKFYCSADDLSEAIKDVESYFEKDARATDPIMED